MHAGMPALNGQVGWSNNQSVQLPTALLDLLRTPPPTPPPPPRRFPTAPGSLWALPACCGRSSTSGTGATRCASSMCAATPSPFPSCCRRPPWRRQLAATPRASAPRAPALWPLGLLPSESARGSRSRSSCGCTGAVGPLSAGCLGWASTTRSCWKVLHTHFACFGTAFGVSVPRLSRVEQHPAGRGAGCAARMRDGRPVGCWRPPASCHYSAPAPPAGRPPLPSCRHPARPGPLPHPHAGGAPGE